MKDNEILLSENYHIQPENQYFFECYSIDKKLSEKSFGIYKYKLEAADTKLRFATFAYEEIRKITDELEVGEFIYFDDCNRLRISFYLEVFLVFARAGFDLAISSYFTYFHDTTNLDSLNDFIKKIKKESDWLPLFSKNTWIELINDYDSEDFTWVKALVGASSGVSLRDKVVHKGLILIDTIINESDKGCFVIHLNSKEVVYLVPWLISTFGQINQYLITIKNDILMTNRGVYESLKKSFPEEDSSK